LRVAVIDTSSLLHPHLGVDGVAALDLFRDAPVTIDYANRSLRRRNGQFSGERARRGDAVRLRVEKDGPSTVLDLALESRALGSIPRALR
jgi:hypothetical protein